MFRRLCLFTIILGAFISGFSQDKPLTNADVVSMVKAGLPESTIILNIERSKANFDTSAQAMIDLNKAGVSAKILDAMIMARPSGCDNIWDRKDQDASKGAAEISQYSISGD